VADLLGKLSGYKTYAFTLAWVAFEVALSHHWVTLDPDTANQVRVGLLGAAGLSLRHAVGPNGSTADADQSGGGPGPNGGAATVVTMNPSPSKN
jgi:hypothetical protein